MRNARRTGRWIVAVTAVLAVAPVLGTTDVAAQEEAAETEAFAEVLYPPELIMKHRRAIELTDGQRDEITALIADLQEEVVRLQWELADGMEELTRTLERPRVDLDRALDQLDAALEIEKRIKQVHMETLIRIKNTLRPGQQAELDRLREEEGAAGAGERSGSGPPGDA